MLPFEELNHQKLSSDFSRQLDCVREVLELGLEISDSLGDRFNASLAQYDNRTKTVVLLILSQLLRRCRAAVIVWHHGYTKETEILTRSLFEAVLAARFVIEPQLPQAEWSHQLRKEFGLLCDLSGPGMSRFTDMNFRAILYASSEVIRLDKKRDTIASAIRPYGQIPDDFGDGMGAAALDAENLIGQEWIERVRKSGSYHGFSGIHLLAEYCGLHKSNYYKSLYGIQSATAHGEGAIGLLNSPSLSELLQALCLPCSILGEALEDFERVFSLGHEHSLRRLAGRIQQEFS